MGGIIPFIKPQKTDLPFCVIAGPRSEHDSAHFFPVKRVMEGKVLDDEGLLEDGIAVTTNEELAEMIRDGILDQYGDRFDEERPEDYMRVFREQAEAYKKKWKSTILIVVDPIDEV